MRFLRSINFRKKIRHAEGFVIAIESASLAPRLGRGSAIDVESETERLRRRVTKFLLSAAREITWKLYCPWIFHFFICRVSDTRAEVQSAVTPIVRLCVSYIRSPSLWFTFRCWKWHFDRRAAPISCFHYTTLTKGLRERRRAQYLRGAPGCVRARGFPALAPLPRLRHASCGRVRGRARVPRATSCTTLIGDPVSTFAAIITETESCVMHCSTL